MKLLEYLEKNTWDDKDLLLLNIGNNPQIPAGNDGDDLTEEQAADYVKERRKYIKQLCDH